MSAPLSTAAEATAPGALQSFFVVLNPGSGEHEAGEVRDAIAGVLRQAGRSVEFFELRPGEVASQCQRAARRAKEAGGALVAVGGDGTLNAAAQAAMASDCPMGVIAQGTFNFFARDHGLPQDAAEGARVLLDAAPQPVQVGLLNERVFLVNASIGLYPQLLEDRETFKQRLGRHRWVAMLSGLKTLLRWRRMLAIEVEMDGRIERMHTPTLFVGNNALQLDSVGVPAALVRKLRDGPRLVGLLAQPHGRWFKLRLMLRGLLGHLGASPEIDGFSFASLTVAPLGHRKLKVATDGEALVMQPPLRFCVAPRPLMLLKPIR
jgi:diacylglycerol kinase family enzyme